MQTLYEAANAIEAHMLVDLLKQQSLSAHIHGEHLQGAMGELPAAGLVRLVIDEADYAKARAVIDHWESQQPAEPAQAKSVGRSLGLGKFLVGLAIGAGLTAALYRTPVTADGIDIDRDGLLDETWTYSPTGRPLKTEIDRNLDHKVDYIAHYDRRGLIETAESDDNFDGVFETHLRFRDNALELSEVDTDGDGFADLRQHFVNGVQDTAEYINPSTGLALRVEHYRLGILTSAEVDNDRDGMLDTRVDYSALGAITSTQRLAP
jgi:hypothetical protein